MQTFLNILRFIGLVIFGVGIVLALVTLLNYFAGFTEAAWLEIVFLRLYLFLTVTGILIYILITFRRRKGEQ